MNKYLKTARISAVTLGLITLALATGTTASETSWKSKGPVEASVESVVIGSTDQQTLYLTTDEGIYKSTSGGATWQHKGLRFRGALTILYDQSCTQEIHCTYLTDIWPCCTTSSGSPKHRHHSR